jgi:adenosine deaminase
MDLPLEIDIAFTRSLPKAELHAHLSGSISSETLHEIWMRKRAEGDCSDLEDPSTAIRPGADGFVDVISFFPLFDRYTYNLCNDLHSVKYAVEKVIESFDADGVRYLELRTTPRECLETGMTKDSYVELVNQISQEWNRKAELNIEVCLILSVDRRMTAEQASQVVDLAIKHQRQSHNTAGQVVGVDLCGNPSKGDVAIFAPAFERAQNNGLGITCHFAEIAESGTDRELSTILSWNPDRLGHCIHVPLKHKTIISGRIIGLEMCLSCNVLTGLTTGGFEQHHLGEWLHRDCPIALSTDDVGIFGSPLSNEYLLASKAFGLSKTDLVDLSRQAVKISFAGRQRMARLLDAFEKSSVMR